MTPAMRVTCLLLALTLAGCAAPSPGTNPTGATTGPCAGGEGALFLAEAMGGGFVAPGTVPRIAEITHEGRISILQGYTREGNGSVVEDKPGALHDLTAAKARQMYERHYAPLGARDLVVTRGDEAALPRGLFDSFCGHVVAALPKLKDDYPNPGTCADEGARTWDVSTTSGTRRIVVDDCADAPDFRPLAHELDTLVGPG